MRALLGPVVICIVVAMSGCSNSNNSAAPHRKLTQSPFTTTFTDRESLLKVSSIVVLDTQWDREAQGCKDHFDPERKLDQVFRSESRLSVLSNGQDSGSDIRSAISANNADGGISLRLIRCVERIGSSFGVSEPAQVGFLMSLYDRSGRAIWTGAFSMKDQAIIDNLLTAGEKLKVGTGWVTASQIFEHGLTLAARELETQRTGFFLNGRN
jgi:hypothetical protein